MRSKPDARPRRPLDRSLAVLADSSAVRYPLRGSVGRIALVVTGDGAAVLALDGLGAAPAGHDLPGVGRPAGLGDTGRRSRRFDGSTRVVPLVRGSCRRALAWR